jgi:hypothetical protein
MATDFVNYYKILQVDTEAETEVIEAAYRRLARKYHPDVNKSPDAEEKMKQFNEARKILTNSKERGIYDRQFEEETQRKQTQGQGASKKQKKREGDNIRDEKSLRNSAAQKLVTIQQALNDLRWRIAKEELYAFEGLGIISEGGPLPTFPLSISEWKKAQKLDYLADQQADDFHVNLKRRSLILYSTLAFIATIFIIVANDDGTLIAGTVFGSIVLIFEGMIGPWAYTKWFAGKLGGKTDNVLGLLTPFIFWVVMGLMFSVVGCFILPVIFAPFMSNKKK